MLLEWSMLLLLFAYDVSNVSCPTFLEIDMSLCLCLGYQYGGSVERISSFKHDAYLVLPNVGNDS